MNQEPWQLPSWWAHCRHRPPAFGTSGLYQVGGTLTLPEGTLAIQPGLQAGSSTGWQQRMGGVRIESGQQSK